MPVDLIRVQYLDSASKKEIAMGNLRPNIGLTGTVALLFDDIERSKCEPLLSIEAVLQQNQALTGAVTFASNFISNAPASKAS